MTRVGWLILALIVLASAAFLAMTSFGPGEGPGNPAAVAQEPPADSLVVPVQGVARAAITNSWGDARGGGFRQHHGTDIMAAAGTPVLAAAPGTVEKLFQSEQGGTTLYVRSDDRRWSYYYAHLAGYADGVREGMTVRAGQRIGFVGDSGDAGAGNYHLHFGVARMAAGRRWWEGEDINPYPLLATGRLPG
jgi:murein DD-endopeptidase MepM/ murein hydrolase activator NlpD